MVDIYPSTRQREALLGFARALGCRDNALRRDECGDWRITGKRGHIYAVPGALDRPKTPGFQIFVMGWTAKGWNLAKQAFKPLASLTNDGDDEGAFFLDCWPTLEEAGIIRHHVGVAKKAEFSEEALAQKREQILTARQKIGQKPPYEGSAGAKEPREPDAGSQQDFPEDNL